MPDDGDAPPGTQVAIQLIRLESHHEVAHRGGQLRTVGNPDHDIALPHAEGHRLHRGPRLLSEDQTAYPDRPQQIQTLVLPKNLAAP